MQAYGLVLFFRAVYHSKTPTGQLRICKYYKINVFIRVPRISFENGKNR